MRHRPWGQNHIVFAKTPTTYRYTGQREEARLGLYYYGERWHDPALGRFIGCPLGADTIVLDPAGCPVITKKASHQWGATPFYAESSADLRFGCRQSGQKVGPGGGIERRVDEGWEFRQGILG